MPHRSTLAEHFPSAVTYERYLARVENVVGPMGFDREHTFAAVSACRDELTHPMMDAVARRWDQPFNLGGLGALPALGRTGWRAALSHVPHEVRRGHLIVFGFPHIGIDPEGRIGASLRRHQHRVTPTCGAMVSLLETLRTGREPLPPGLDDHEAERLHRVVQAVADEQLPGDHLPHDLVELTKLAVRAVDDAIWTELDALGAHRAMDVAVFSAIQIHLPDDVDHVLPSAGAFRGADGERRPLEI